METYPVPTHEIDWASLISPEHWSIYKRVLGRAKRSKAPFAIGGGLAVGIYTGIGRYTKDLDLYILPEHRDWAIDLVTQCGMSDYFETKPYDREWIYRACKGDAIVDSIWAMANQRAVVDEDWLDRGPRISIFDQEFRVIPVEELIWSKLYVLQRDRCDWPDILNLISATGSHLDWNHLMSRIGDDLPLMKGLISVFSWISPERAAQLPVGIWKILGLESPAPAADSQRTRPRLLDSRPWYCETVAA